jgi:hypothetical protein
METFEHHGKRKSKASRADLYMNDGVDIFANKEKGDIVNGKAQVR